MSILKAPGVTLVKAWGKWNFPPGVNFGSQGLDTKERASLLGKARPGMAGFNWRGPLFGPSFQGAPIWVNQGLWVPLFRKRVGASETEGRKMFCARKSGPWWGCGPHLDGVFFVVSLCRNLGAARCQTGAQDIGGATSDTVLETRSLDYQNKRGGHPKQCETPSGTALYRLTRARRS